MADSGSSQTSPLSPVSDGGEDQPAEGIALCLSGGGYRAMVFHLGSLIRLNELGYLSRVDRVSSVSGGSITAAMLGLKWRDLEFVDGIARRLIEEVVDPIRSFAGVSVDAKAILSGIFLPGTIADKVERAYDKHLFHGATLQDLPDDPPRFVINATNVQTGALWRFSKPYMRDYQVGEVRDPKVPLAKAVAASSAFPPVLSPARLDVDLDLYSPAEGELHHSPEFMNQVFLTDGGVYDNLGLETAWKRYRTILISDAGQAMAPDADPGEDWASHARRVLDLVDNQVRALRKRQVLGSFKAGARRGTYWSVSSDIGRYATPGALHCPLDRTTALAQVPTRLSRLSVETQDRLVNWGYAITDAAVRKWMDPGLPPPDDFACPGGV